MGMVPFLVIAAAEKRRRDASAAASRRRKAEEERRRKKSEESHHYSSSSKRELSYTECLFQEMIYENPKLLEFFEKLDSAVTEAIGELTPEQSKHLEECLALLGKYKEQLNGVVKKIGETGLSVDNLSYGVYRSAYDGRYNRAYTSVTFDGVRIPKNMAENPNDKTYEDEYNQVLEKNRDLLMAEIETRSNIARLEKRLNGHYFIRSHREDDEREYAKAKQKLEDIKYAKEKVEAAKKKRDVVAKLTPEQRKLIVEFYSIIEPIEQVSELIETHSRAVCKARKENPRDKKEIIERAFEILGARENLSKEDIAELFDELDRIAIRRNRGEYSERYETYEQSQVKDRLRGTVHGFIKHIYEADPKFVERNAWEIHPEEQEQE